MIERLQALLSEALEELNQAADKKDVEKVRVKYLGKKAPLQKY